MTPDVRSLLEAFTRMSLRVRMPSHLGTCDEIQASMSELCRKLLAAHYHVPTVVKAIDAWDAAYWPTWHDLARELPSPDWRPGRPQIEAPKEQRKSTVGPRFDRLGFIAAMRSLHDPAVPHIPQVRQSLIRIGEDIAERRGIPQEAWS